MPNNTNKPRIILEKSSTVRRRYQRSNKRFQFTASQIARIEREEERERRAKKLREKEKRRIKEKKERAEKEAKAAQERLRLGLPDPNAPRVPASQPLLFDFVKRGKVETPLSGEKEREREANGEEEEDGRDGTGSQTATEGSQRTEVASDFGEHDSDLDDTELDSAMIALVAGEDATGGNTTQQDGRGKNTEGDDDDDEFSDCSVFYDEDVIKKTEALASAERVTKGPVVPALTSGDSFHDETAALLEEFAHEFDPGQSFEQELVRLDGVR